METFFLACFIFGLLFTLASLALGAVGGGHFGGHSTHIAHPVGHHAHLPHAASHDGDAVPWLNASSAVGGLTWFGAAGYLLTRFGDLAVLGAIIGGLAAGAVGWYLVARFLGLVLKGESEMDPADYRLEGTVANVTVPIPAGGTGEVVFEKGGSRRGEAARALNGAAIPRGAEVVITAYAKGFATVQPWGEFMDEHDRQARLAEPSMPKREA
jgi:membrane protein implicated in regulation of membrane protease activity